MCFYKTKSQWCVFIKQRTKDVYLYKKEPRMCIYKTKCQGCVVIKQRAKDVYL